MKKSITVSVTRITRNKKETQRFAAGFAGKILGKKLKQAIIIGLIGDLGSGKTVFAQGFAKRLGIKENIVSPTFVIEKIYKIKVKDYKLFIHIDAYRIEKSKEILDLGFKNLTCDSKNIILIEWADKIGNILPKKSVQIKFEHIKGSKRKITIKSK